MRRRRKMECGFVVFGLRWLVWRIGKSSRKLSFGESGGRAIDSVCTKDLVAHES